MDDENSKITGLEAAKALRVICPHARQLGALSKYVREYEGGNPLPYAGSVSYYHMYDSLASDYGIRLCAVLRHQCGNEYLERFGSRMMMEDLPEFLEITADADMDSDDIPGMLLREKDNLFALKDRALYIAGKKKELKYEYTGFDDGVCWHSVLWHDRGFLVPASAGESLRCRDIGAPQLPPTLTGSVPRQVRYRRAAENARTLIEGYLEQNQVLLSGYDEWFQNRDPAFLERKRGLN